MQKSLLDGYGKWLMFFNIALPVLLLSFVVSGNIEAYVNDASIYLVTGMGLLFLYGWSALITSFFSTRTASKDFKLRRARRLGIIPTILAFVGLIGTVAGFIWALDNADFGKVSVNSAADLTRIMGVIVDGVGLALHTTFIGAVSSLYLNVNIAMWICKIEDDHEPV